jgi:hypothetical protein
VAISLQGGKRIKTEAPALKRGMGCIDKERKEGKKQK